MTNVWVDIGAGFYYLIDERFVHAIANELQNPKLTEFPDLRPSFAEVLNGLVKDGYLVVLFDAKMIVAVNREVTPEELVTAFFVEALIT